MGWPMILTVYGTPAQQGSKRFLGRTKSGRGIMAEASDKTAPWRSAVINACTEYRKDNPDFVRITGAVVARLIFTFDRPPSVSRKRRPFMSVAPDLDKLLRATLDGLTAGGVMKDDALVCDLTRVAKVYCSEDEEALDIPGALIVVRELLPLDQLGGSLPLLDKES